MRFLLSVLLALAAIFSADSDTVSETVVPDVPAAPAAVETAEPEQYDPEQMLPDYFEYDTREFYRDCSELMSVLSMWPDPDAVNKAYDKLYEEYAILYSLDTAAYLDYARDVSDDAAAEAMLQSASVLSECGNELCVACHAVMNGPNADAFAGHVGAEAAAYYAAYEEPDSRDAELQEREQELISEYYTALDETDAMNLAYGGRDWSMNDLNGSDGDRLYERDPYAFWEIYDTLEEQANDILGPIFVELVDVRTEIAEAAGYDNFADYAYECRFGRDFSADDAAYFCDQVRRCVSGEYYDRVFYLAADPGPDMSASELLDMLGQYAGRIDPSLEQAYRFMTENGLCDIGDESRRMESSFCIDLPAADTSFLFQKMYGGYFDFLTLTHEFGHFFETWQNGVPDILTAYGNMDVSEIHSNGLELLYTAFYGEIFGDRAPEAVSAVLADELGGVVDGCIFDEFQRRVYEKKSVTVEEVNRIYCEVCREFGEDESGDEDCYWMYVPHNYESPLYYISYAASSLAALQIWDLSREDLDAAAAQWMAVVDEGYCGDGYLTVLEKVGLRSFTEDGAVGEICRPALDYIEDVYPLW